MTSPIIETNIERMLEDHLWPEIIGIEARIAELQNSINVLSDRRLKLINISDSANINRPRHESNDSDVSYNGCSVTDGFNALRN
jgi:hypothetical protein